MCDALAIANDGDTIEATSISGVIILTSSELPVNASVRINGTGANVLAIDGGMTSRVFRIVSSDLTVTISGFTIRNGRAGTTGGGIDNENNSILPINNCTVSSNTAGLGGGIFNGGTLTVANSTISGNSAGFGGGIYNLGTVQIGDTILNTSTISSSGTVTSLGCFHNGPFD